jgi:hypothetical protein
MTYKQQKLVEWMQHHLVVLEERGYNDLAKTMGQVISFLNKEEYVWAVIIASVSNLGPVFVDRLRETFNVGRIE